MRLLNAAVRAEDYDAVIDLLEQTSSYQSAAYDAARMRVDDVSMNLLNKPAAELYLKTSRMNLETTTMRAPGIKFLRQSNAAMLTAKAKAIANKAAAISTDDNDVSSKKRKTKRSRADRVNSAQESASGRKDRSNTTQESQKKEISKSTNKNTDNASARPAGAPQTAATSAAAKSGPAAAAGGQ